MNFLLGFLAYARQFKSKINLNVVFRIRSKYELDYSDEQIIEKYCMQHGDYCVGPETSKKFDSNF